MKLYAFQGKCNLSGERVRLARERAGLSQEQLAARLLAEEITLSQKAISRLETGLRVVPDYELPALAKALQVDILWLLEAEEAPEQDAAVPENKIACHGAYPQISDKTC